MLSRPPATAVAGNEKMVPVNVGARSETGLVRQHNEDAWLVDQPRGIFVVADGLGGHAAGEVASQVGVAALHEALVPGDGQGFGEACDPADLVRAALFVAHNAVLDSAAAESSRWGMASTAVVAYLPTARPTMWVGHAGDSRAYLLRGERLDQLTSDHHTAGPLGGLTQALGLSGTLRPGIARVELAPGDRVLLCTDGLTGLVDQDTLARLAAGDDAQHCADALVDAALERGGIDNITAVVLDPGSAR